MDKLIGIEKILYEIDNLKEIPNILFSGTRGTGKTALAEKICKDRNKNLILLTGHTLKKKELIQILLNLKENDLILIDEIHSLKSDIEEVLYLPIERHILPLQNERGNSIIISLPKFSFIATTTKSSKLSKPLISRFQLHIQIPQYNLRTLARIVKDRFSKLSITDCLKIAINIMTPREAINLAKRITNFPMSVSAALEFIGYYSGLSAFERQYLRLLKEVKRMALNSISFAMQLDRDEIRKLEDKLIKLKYIEIKSTGRSLLPNGEKIIEKIKLGG